MTMLRALTALAVVLLGTLRLYGTAAAPTGTIRVLSYNIHHGEGTDGVFDLARLAGIITDTEPDLVALQEVDQATERANGVHQAEELGALTRMHVVFGRAMEYQGGEYGVAILSRWPFLRTANRPLPHADGYEPRTALSVDVQPEQRSPRLTFTTTHLDQGRDATNRLLQAAALNELLAKDDGAPSILAGDMNSRLDTEVMEKLRSLWTDMFVEPAPTNPGERPRYRVDYVMARPGNRWRSLDSQSIVAPLASDHRPVLAVLRWEGN